MRNLMYTLKVDTGLKIISDVSATTVAFFSKYVNLKTVSLVLKDLIRIKS